MREFRLVTMRARGQALIETAIALPVFLIAMFGVVWSLQSGVLGERVQMAARYGGMVSAQGNPFQQYSLYGVYGAAAGTPVVAPCGCRRRRCSPTAARWSRRPRPARSSGSPPARPTVSGTCGRTLSTAAGLSGPKLLGHAQMTVDATNDVPHVAASRASAARPTPWNATINQLESPDMATLVACYPELQAGFAASVSPSARERERAQRERDRAAADEPALARGGCSGG